MISTICTVRPTAKVLEELWDRGLFEGVSNPTHSTLCGGFRCMMENEEIPYRMTFI